MKLSFTFVNSDPKAAICVDLAGKTFASNDAESLRLAPPLHHNCKSILEPNFRGAKGNPELSKGGLQGQATDTGIDSINLNE